MDTPSVALKSGYVPIQKITRRKQRNITQCNERTVEKIPKKNPFYS